MNLLMLCETKNLMLVHIIGMRSTITLQSAPNYLKMAVGGLFFQDLSDNYRPGVIIVAND